MKTRFLALLAPVALLATSILAAAPTPASATATPSFATWTSSSAGTMSGVDVTFTGGVAAPTTQDMSGAAYVPPGSATQSVVMWPADQTASFSFSQPITNPTIYLGYLRGPGSQGPTSYALAATGGTCVWSVSSGNGDAAIAGNGSQLDAPTVGFENMVVLCTGTVTGVSLTPAAGGGSSAQNITIAGSLAEPAPTTTEAPAVDPVSPSFTG